ncbi:hypothetical protein JB92DRAFT_2901039 [Gautieria morchelliformis]|nr:hypothetical protein JB92DRAFT_2901039 [Gautieria morchelliformis]
MHFIAILSVLIPLANAYPLGSPFPMRVVELAKSDYAGIALQSPIPVFLPDAIEEPLHLPLSGVTPPSSIASRDFATSFVTTLLGGGLALYFT